MSLCGLLCIFVFLLVPGAGLEPARRNWPRILSPLCLPIPSSRQGHDVLYTTKRIHHGAPLVREALAGIEPAHGGFADRSVTTSPQSRTLKDNTFSLRYQGEYVRILHILHKK